jgi:hypothetical protein
MNEIPEVFNRTRRSHRWEVRVTQHGAGNDQGVDGVGLGMVALVAASEGGQLGRYLNHRKALSQQAEARLPAQASRPFDTDPYRSYVS